MLNKHGIMRVALISGVLAGMGVMAAAQQYRHERIGEFPSVVNLGITEWGDYWFVAETDRQGQLWSSNLYVNGASYSEDMFSGYRRTSAPLLFPDGDMYWSATYEEGGRRKSHLFRNKENYSAPRYGDDRMIGDFAVNASKRVAAQVSIEPYSWGAFDIWVDDDNVTLPALGTEGDRSTSLVRFPDDGRVFWGGRGLSTAYYWDQFENDTNLSAGPLGRNRRTGSMVVNSSGSFAWDGYGDLTAGNQNVFLGQQNLSADVLGTVHHTAFIRGISEDGAVAWAAHVAGDPADIYRDTVNLSSWLGEGRDPNMYFVYMSPAGRVVWSASAPTLGSGNVDLFVDDTNLTMAVLGDNRRAHFYAFSSSGQVIWGGTGTAIAYWDLFVDGYSPSQEALAGTGYYFGLGGVGNTHGRLLWIAKRYDDSGQEYHELWLSTPVPEPSALLFALPLLALLRRRRRGG